MKIILPECESEDKLIYSIPFFSRYHLEMKFRTVFR